MGRALSLEFAKSGHAVIALVRPSGARVDALAELFRAGGIAGRVVAADVTQPAEVAALRELPEVVAASDQTSAEEAEPIFHAPTAVAAVEAPDNPDLRVINLALRIY